MSWRQFFGNRPLIILGAAESVSAIGNWISMMAVFAMIVFRGEGTVTQSSGIFLAGLLPILLFSPAAGWLVDRYDRRRLMLVSELLSGAVIAGLIVVSNVWLIYLILALQAVSVSIMLPARQAAVPDIVAAADLARANAFLQQLAGIIKIGAPMLAGAILTILTPQQAVILDVISFLLSALILTRLPALPPASSPNRLVIPRMSAEPALDPPDPAPIPSPLAVLTGSLRLRLLFTMIFLGIFVIVGFDVLAPVFIRDILHGDEGLFGLLIGLVGLGTVVAAGGLLLSKTTSRPWRDLVAGMVLLSCIPLAMAAVVAIGDQTLALTLVAAGCFAGGIGNGLLVVQMSTLLQQLSPPAVLGRIGGLFQSVTTAG